MKYIPVWEFCKKYNIPKQNIYRWIRERKVEPENIRKETKMIEKTVLLDDERIIPKSWFEKLEKQKIRDKEL